MRQRYCLRSDRLDKRFKDNQPDIRAHCIRVGVCSEIMGSCIIEDIIKHYGKKELDLKTAILQIQANLVDGGIYHDLGKAMIPKDILNKPAKLTEPEREVIKLHTLNTERLLKLCRDDFVDDIQWSIVFDMGRYHHEKYNGNGYPYNLKGDEIPLVAQLCAVADVYDALVSERCYKEKQSFAEAREIINNSMNTDFSPISVDCFNKSIDEIEELYFSRSKYRIEKESNKNNIME